MTDPLDAWLEDAPLEPPADFVAGVMRRVSATEAAAPPSPLRWLRPLLAVDKQIGKEAVVAIPAARVVLRLQKEIGLFQSGQHALAVVAPGDRVAQIRRERTQDRRLEQKVADLLGLLVEHFLQQVIHDEAMAAGERVDEPGQIISVTHGERGHLQPGDPPFGALFQRGNLVRRQIQTHDVTQEGGGLLGGEAEIGRAHFGQFAPGAQTSQRPRRVGAPGQRHVETAGQIVQKEEERLVDLGRGDDVIVVHDELQARRRGGGNAVDQPDDGGFQRPRRQRIDDGIQGHGVVDAWDQRLERGAHVRPEAHRVVVALVQRKPGHGLLQVTGPGAQRGGLAEARRRRHQREFAAQPRVELGGDARPRHQRVAQGRHEELRLEQGVRHRGISENGRATTCARARKWIGQDSNL